MTTLSKNQPGNAQLTCIPLSALADKKVNINIRGLQPRQEITLQARLTGDVQDRYRSIAHYTADENGEVCLSTLPSVGGSYVGVEPMGFIWSMKPESGQKPGRRLMKRDVTKPFIINLDVLDGHEPVCDNKVNTVPSISLCNLKIERHYMGSGVRTIEVREGRVRGTLFLPPGEGPFQGVMDLIGGHGGLVEFKAALLASNGFAAFSLAYIFFEDLPNSLEDLELEYLIEAVTWFKNHPQVISGGVGVMGISKGAEMAVLLAAHCKDVAAVISINGLHGLSFFPILYKGIKLNFFKEQLSKVIVLNDVTTLRYSVEDDWKGRIQDNPKAFPVENIQGQLMLIYGTDDCVYNTEESASKVKERMKAFGKGDQCSLLGYHGAGHLIEPPYSPHFGMSFQKSLDKCMAWGGEAKPHAVAQEHSWPKILEFFQRNLPHINAQSKL